MAVPLEPVAGVGVAHRHHEEREADSQHDEIQHGMLLSDTKSKREHIKRPILGGQP